MILPQTRLSRLSKLTLAALATLLGHVGVASAAPTVSASTAATVATGSATPANFGLAPDSYVNSQSSIDDLTGRGIGYAFAHDGGAYAVNSVAVGIASGTAHAQFLNRYQNLSGVAQHYTLSFHIYGGSISAQSNGYRALTSGETLLSSYAATVKTSFNDGATWDSVFSSAATLSTDENGSALTRSGTVLTGAEDPVTGVADGDYYWSNDYYTVDLGVVAAGAYFDVLAEVDNNAVSNVGIYNFATTDCGYGYGYGYGYGGGGDNCGSDYVGRASSFYGDPLDFGGAGQPPDTDGFVLTATAVAQDLPEPASLALAGLAIGAAGVARRRRRGG